jgi:hypothetical protein
MSIICSESHSFPNHFRQEIAPARNSAATNSTPLIEPEEPPRTKSFFLFFRNLLPARREKVLPSTAVSESSHEQSSPQPITAPTRHEDAVSKPVAKPEASSKAGGLFAAVTSEAANGKSAAAPTALPAKGPLRKSVVPPGLKRKARWNLRGAPMQPAPPQTNGSSQIRPANVPEQKMSSKGLRRPAPLPHFVQEPPPNLVQAMLAYAAKVPGPAAKPTAPEPKTDGVDTP